MGARTFVNNRFSFSFTRNWARGLDVPLVLTVFVQFGKQIAPLVQHGPWLVLGAVLIAATALTARYVWIRYRGMAGEPLPETCLLPAT